MKIRIMSIDDYESVYHLWISTPGMGLNNVDDSKEGIGKYLERNPTTCFVAEDGESIIGVIGNTFWEKLGFSVREDLVYRNKGIRELIRIDT